MGESDEKHTTTTTAIATSATTTNTTSNKTSRDNCLDDHNDHDIDVEAKLLGNGKPNNADANTNGDKAEQDLSMTEEINKLLQEMPLADDVTCGFWIFKGPTLQKFANQTAYVVLYGLVGSIFSMTYAYFNGTITTIEKRFKIPSRNTGIISVGNDISQMLVSAVLSYYAGKGHRPRWIGIGLLTIVAFCLLTALPHFVWGPGEDAKSLTYEFGGMPDENATLEVMEKQRSKLLCRTEDNGAACEMGEGNLAPQLVLFIAQFISGIGGSLYYTLGVAYMDDNTKKSKTPALLSLSYFLRMLGPATGYALASFCLRVYIVPHLRPIISDKDPRWLGAWWMGWLIIAGLLSVLGIFLSMFPKQLPRAAARRIIENERRKKAALRDKNLSIKEKYVEEMQELHTTETEASVKDMLKTFKRLTRNKTLMYNNLSSVFYLFGYTPYWIFTAKYIEIQYRQSASTSSMVTGTVALAFSAFGILLSGLVISKFKPRARYMAAWNVIVGILTVGGIMSYAFIGCSGNESSVVVNIPDSTNNSTTCNSACHCDYVRYSPVCGENNMTYISPCHAGCKKQYISPDGRKFFYDCSCIPKLNASQTFTQYDAISSLNYEAANDMSAVSTTTLPTSLASTYPELMLGGSAMSGACPVNCFAQFVTFLAVMCCMKFFGSTGRATNFLVSVRCVPEKDKTAAMGFGIMLMSMFAFIPSPIFFGWLLDRLCLVWGKTCTNKGNCWLYDPELLRYALNFTAAVFLAFGTLFDIAVWYYVKDLKIFDEEVKEVEMKIVQHEEEQSAEKKAEM